MSLRKIEEEIEKIELTVQEISKAVTYRGLYILLLQERDGSRKLPLMLNLSDARALSRKIHPEQTGGDTDAADMMRDMAAAYGIRAEEVLIYRVERGEFMAFLFFSRDNEVRHIVARAADAILAALTFGCPIFIMAELFERQYLRELGGGVVSFPLNVLSLELLEDVLRTAVENENYELASQIRDEIKRRR